MIIPLVDCESYGMSMTIFSFRIPFTRLQFQLVKVVLEHAQEDELKKEITVRALGPAR